MAMATAQPISVDPKTKLTLGSSKLLRFISVLARGLVDRLDVRNHFCQRYCNRPITKSDFAALVGNVGRALNGVGHIPAFVPHAHRWSSLLAALCGCHAMCE